MRGWNVALLRWRVTRASGRYPADLGL